MTSLERIETFLHREFAVGRRGCAQQLMTDLLSARICRASTPPPTPTCWRPAGKAGAAVHGGAGDGAADDRQSSSGKLEFMDDGNEWLVEGAARRGPRGRRAQRSSTAATAGSSPTSRLSPHSCAPRRRSGTWPPPRRPRPRNELIERFGSAATAQELLDAPATQRVNRRPPAASRLLHPWPVRCHRLPSRQSMRGSQTSSRTSVCCSSPRAGCSPPWATPASAISHSLAARLPAGQRGAQPWSSCPGSTDLRPPIGWSRHEHRRTASGCPASTSETGMCGAVCHPGSWRSCRTASTPLDSRRPARR